MKKSTLLVVVLLLAFTPVLNAQVGIGTTNPKALLHIVAPPGTSPEESGIILPKVSVLPTANLDGKKGMFLYLDSNNSEEGIYFFNGEKWKKNDNAWRLGGNTLTANEFIGTKNQKDLNFKVDNKQRLKIGADGDLEYQNANNNKLIGISNNGNYTINNANNNKLIEIKNNGVITLPYTDLVDINSNKKSIATKEYVDTNLASSSGGVLEEITEGANTGYRINGSTNAANFGDIGNEAVDLSYSSSTSTSRGATGDYSFAVGIDNLAYGDYSFATGQSSGAHGPNSIAMGRDNRAMARYSTAIGGLGNDTWGWYSFATGKETIANSYAECSLGHFNTNLTAKSTSGINTLDRVLSVGIGTNHWGRADALEIFKDGTIYADELEVSEITKPKQLVTKEYVDANGGGGVLEKITEGTFTYPNGTIIDKTGYRINGSGNADNYGDIGIQAVDLSYNGGSSTTRGATNWYTFAAGYTAEASGSISAVLGGANNIASGYNSTTVGGYKNTASGSYSLSGGYGTKAQTYGEVALGLFNDPLPTYTGYIGDTGFKAQDRILSVGIGTSDSDRKNAIEVFKDGTIYADELDITEITDDQQLVTKKYVDTNITDDQTAAEVTYDNTTSGLTATNVKDAIDELADSSSGGSSGSINVGDEYLGGIVFHTWNNGTNGLIVSKVNLNDDDWGVNTIEIYSKGAALFSGEMNTILHKMEYPDGDYAGNQALAYSASFNGDSIGGWYLPSIDELELFLNVAYSNSTVNSVLNFETNIKSKEYWSSTEIDVKYVNISKIDHNGIITRDSSDKHSTRRVRVIKSF